MFIYLGGFIYTVLQVFIWKNMFFVSQLLSDTSQGEFDDREILHLQEKASRLLLRGYKNCWAILKINGFSCSNFFFSNSECSVSDGSVPVSSEGLGCSDFSSPISIDEPVKQPLIPSLFKNTTGRGRVWTRIPFVIYRQILFCVLLCFKLCVNIYSKGQLRLSSWCVLPKICHAFFGASYLSRGRHIVPVAFKEENGTSQREAPVCASLQSSCIWLAVHEVKLSLHQWTSLQGWNQTVCYIIHILCTNLQNNINLLFRNSRVPNPLNSHKEILIHTSLMPSQKPLRPRGSVPQLQALCYSPPSMFLVQSLSCRALPMFLPTCIFSVTSCHVPSSHLMPKCTRAFHKG